MSFVSSVASVLTTQKNFKIIVSMFRMNVKIMVTVKIFEEGGKCFSEMSS